MTSEDITAIEAEYEKAYGSNRSALQSRQDVRGWVSELDQQQAAINQALDGIDALETHYNGEVKRYQQLRDEAADKKRKLTRAFDDCKRTAIRLQQNLKTANLPRDTGTYQNAPSSRP